MNQLRNFPLERLIEVDEESDGLKSLRALRERYEAKYVNPKIKGNYYRDSARAVDDLMGPMFGETLLEATSEFEPVLSNSEELRILETSLEGR
jgi:hypothetical protein